MPRQRSGRIAASPQATSWPAGIPACLLAAIRRPDPLDPQRRHRGADPSRDSGIISLEDRPGAAGQRPADLRAAPACCCWQEGRDSSWPGMGLGARRDAARALGRHRRYGRLVSRLRARWCDRHGIDTPAGPKGETMIRSVTRLKELSRHPRMLLVLPAAVLGVTLAACGGGSAAHPAAPKPTSAAPSHSHAAPPSAPATTPPKHARRPPRHRRPHASGAGHYACRAVGHRPGPYRQSDPAGQRRRP